MESDGDADKCIYTAEVKTSCIYWIKKLKDWFILTQSFFAFFIRLFYLIL